MKKLKLKKISINKKTKIIALSLLFALVIAIVVMLCLSATKDEDSPRTSYKMTLAYDAQTHTLSGSEEVTYINNNENMFTYLYLHLYPNAFREGAKNSLASVSIEDKLYVNGLSYGNITVSSVECEGEALEFNVEGEDENILRVDLPVELYPDEQITFSIDFSVTLSNINHRLGYGNNTINFGNFYPILCVYEDGIGFKTDLYHSNGDPFYSEVANYEVSLTYPSEYTLASSGKVLSSQEGEGIVTANILGENIRDFCFVLSDIFEVVSANVDGTQINYYGYRGDNNLQTNLSTAQEALSTFNNLFGKYPYEVLNVVKTNFVHGGMEYPNLVYISDSLSQEDIAYVIVHEIAHQWWYGVVGNDENSHAWLDEGLAEYSTLLFFENNTKYGVDCDAMIDSALTSYKTFVRVYSSVNGEVDTSMDRPLSDFATEPEYVQNTYTKGLLMFDSLRKSTGDRKFFKALKNYYKDFCYKNVTPAEFIASFIDSTGYNLENFINSWLNGEVVFQ